MVAQGTARVARPAVGQVTGRPRRPHRKLCTSACVCPPTTHRRRCRSCGRSSELRKRTSNVTATSRLKYRATSNRSSAPSTPWRRAMPTARRRASSRCTSFGRQSSRSFTSRPVRALTRCCCGGESTVPIASGSTKCSWAAARARWRSPGSLLAITCCVQRIKLAKARACSGRRTSCRPTPEPRDAAVDPMRWPASRRHRLVFRPPPARPRPAPRPRCCRAPQRPQRRP